MIPAFHASAPPRCARLGQGLELSRHSGSIRHGGLNAFVAIVCSDVAESGHFETGARRGIPTACIEEARFRTRLSTEREEDLVERLRSFGVQLVVLAGYMRMLKAPTLDAFPRHIINIHPSLLPKFPGLEAWRRALEAGETVTGCTVHFVDEGMDSGDIIAQAEVPIVPDDTPETLHARIQQAEHRLYPEVVARFARGELP